MKFLKWALIIIIGIFAILLIIYFVTRKKHSKITDIFNPVQEPSEPPPADAPAPSPSDQPTSSGWIKEKFPLNVGMYGPKIRIMQRALGIDDDGKFGSIETKPAVIAAGYSVPVSESDYNKITEEPSAAIPKTNDSLEANKDNVQLYDDGLNPTIKKNKNEFIGTALSVNTQTRLVRWFRSGQQYGYVYLDDVQVG